MGVVRPSGIPYLSTTSTRKKVANSKKKAGSTKKGRQKRRKNSSTGRPKKGQDLMEAAGNTPPKDHQPNGAIQQEHKKQSKNRQSSNSALRKKPKKEISTKSGRRHRGKLVGAAAAAHERKLRREEAKKQGKSTSRMEDQPPGSNEPLQKLDGEGQSVPVDIVVTQTMLNSSFTLTRMATTEGGTPVIESESQKTVETSKILTVADEEKIGNDDSGKGGKRKDPSKQNGSAKLHGAAAEAKKGNFMGAAAKRHAERMEMEEQKEESPLVIISDGPAQKMRAGMGLRSGDHQLQIGRHLISSRIP